MPISDSILVLDIETAPDIDFNTLSTTRDFAKRGFKGAENWKPETIERKREEYVDNKLGPKAALDPIFGKIRAIGCGTIRLETGEEDTQVFASEDEAEVIAWFCNYWDSLYAHFEHTTICGFNIRLFDLPFLLTRMAVHGIFPSAYFPDSPRDRKMIFDLFDFYHGRTLDLLLHRFGLPQKIGKGADAPNMALDELRRYCRHDVEMERELIKRNAHLSYSLRTLLTGEVTPARSRTAEELMKHGFDESEVEQIERAKADAEEPEGRAADIDI